LDNETKRQVELKLDLAMREACIAAYLKGGSGVEPSFKTLDHDLKTLPPEKQRIFITTFIKTALGAAP